MNINQIYSKNKIAIILGLIFLLFILIVFSDSSLNFFSNSESDYEKSSQAPQSKSKNDLLLEKESNENKKKDTVLENKKLDVQNSNEKDFLKNNTLNNEKIKKNSLSSNLSKKNNDPLKVFTDPVMTVNFLHEGIKRINANKNSDLMDILKIIDQTYDAEKMLKMIIGEDWKKIESKKKKELIVVFKRYISKNYLKRFTKIKEISFENAEKEKISSELFLIRSNFFIKKEKVSIDYLLSLKNNSWKIFDVLLDGSVSEIATKKSEFHIFIKEKKIDSLIDALKKFNSQMPNWFITKTVDRGKCWDLKSFSINILNKGTQNLLIIPAY